MRPLSSAPSPRPDGGAAVQAHPSLADVLRQHPVFRHLWLASGGYFIANAMHVMAAAWLMIELTGSSFLAALVQTAVFLPMFALVLPSGVLADTSDRRRLILAALLTQAAAVLLLAVLLAAGLAGPAVILLLTLVAGCCTAVMSPAWNSSIAEIVPREDFPQAIVAISIAYNGARALGPTVAGVVYGLVKGLGGPLAGGSAVFALALAGALGMAWAIHRWPPAPHPVSKLPPERLWGGTLTGLRYAWHSDTILAQLVRTAAFSAAGSALFALLPVIGKERLGMGAAGFGLLMGCLGGGAVLAGLMLGRIRQRFGLDRLITYCGVIYAATMLIAVFSRWPLLVYASLVVGGGAWMSAMSTFNTATQTSAPPWIRSRATALHVLSALGPFALGSAVWGALGGLLGLQGALGVATVAMLAGLLLARWFPLRINAVHEVTQAPFEDLMVADAPADDEGPVAVELSYRIREGDEEAFLAEIARLKGPRRRDGASFWRVYRDLDDPCRFTERFIVTDWATYRHQRARATMADQLLEEGLRGFLAEGERVTVKHYIAER